MTFLEDEQKSKQKAGEPKKEPDVIATLPQSAIHTDGTTKYVFVLKNGVLERHAVTVGSSRGTDVEIQAGVQPGVQVVVKGPENLSDGMEVQLKQ